MNFVLIPNHVYSKKYLPKEYQYIIWEHPHYFTSYIYNKKKLMLHRASLQYQYSYMKRLGYNVKYINFYQIMKESHFTMYDPIDKIDFGDKKITILQTPNFLVSTTHLEMYRAKTSSFIFNNFYMWNKKKLGILSDIKSYDKMNRKRLPKGMNIPSVPSNTDDHLYIDKAKHYVEKHFQHNYGNTKEFIYPISHSTAKKWLKEFIKHKSVHFGDYQDFIHDEHNFMFHSV